MKVYAGLRVRGLLFGAYLVTVTRVAGRPSQKKDRVQSNMQSTVLTCTAEPSERLSQALCLLSYLSHQEFRDRDRGLQYSPSKIYFCSFPSRL